MLLKKKTQIMNGNYFIKMDDNILNSRTLRGEATYRPAMAMAPSNSMKTLLLLKYQLQY